MDQLTIYADESYNEDNYVLAGFLASGANVEEISSAWRHLQEEMKEVLLREYPLSVPKLQGDALPEIKASALFKSSGYYSQNTSGKRHYWEQQWEWLRRAREISTRTSAQSFALRLAPGATPEPVTGQLLLSETFLIEDKPFPKSVRDAMNRIELNRHAAMVSMFLCAMGSALESAGKLANVVWDEHALGNIIGRLQTPKMLRERGVFGHLLDHSFADSRFVPMLQAADIHAYLARAESDAQYGNPPQHYDILRSIIDQHPGESLSPGTVDIWQWSLSRLPLVEMVFIGAGGTKAFQENLRANLPNLLEFAYHQFEQAAFHMERQAAQEAAQERSFVTRIRKMFSGRGARTSTTDFNDRITPDLRMQTDAEDDC